jgi:hypothetical protein
MGCLMITHSNLDDIKEIYLDDMLIPKEYWMGFKENGIDEMSWLIPNIRYLDIWKKENNFMRSLLHGTLWDTDIETLTKYYGLTEEDLSKSYNVSDYTGDSVDNINSVLEQFDLIKILKN